MDPGTLKIGAAAVSFSGTKPHLLYCRTIALKGEDLPMRLRYQFELLQQLIELYKPQVLVTEKQFVYKNVRSTLLVGQSRGVILLAAALANVPVVELTPTRIKKSVTGTGHASKAQIQKMVQWQLGLPSLPSEDAADALAMCLCYSGFRGLHDRLSSRPHP